jgi:hypothetical protein
LPVNELAKRSAERINTDKEFQKVSKFIDITKIQMAKTETISLKWEKLNNGQNNVNLKWIL